MNNVIALPRRSMAPSEPSVNSPQPPSMPMPAPPRAAAFYNSDAGVLAAPYVARLRAQPMAASRYAKPATPAQAPAQPAPAKPSVLKRVVLGAGALCALGVVPGLLSIVALGPVGLAVAAGAAALSAWLIAMGSKLD